MGAADRLQAVEGNLDYAEFLMCLLADEIERRESKQLALRLRKASLDHERTLDDFDFSFNPKTPKSQIIDLATCSFIARQENVLLIGPTGVGIAVSITWGDYLRETQGLLDLLRVSRGRSR